MIHLTRLNHLPLVLNADLIESVEVTPDTVISLTTGQKLVVLESPDEVVRRVVDFRRAIYHGVSLTPSIEDRHDGSTGVSENRRGHGTGF